MSDEIPDEWLPIPEAMERLGISEHALRSRVARRSIRSRRDNSGTLVVCVSEQTTKRRRLGANLAPSRQQVGANSPTTDAAATAATTEAPAVAASVVSLDDVRAMLGEVSARHGATMAALERSHRAALELLIERVDSSEIARERLESRLFEILDRKPWWRRFFGVIATLFVVF